MGKEELDVLKEMILEAKRNLIASIQEYNQSLKERRIWEEHLSALSSKALVEGKISGKNAEEREAQRRELLEEEYRKLLKAEIAVYDSRARLEKAKVEFEAVKMLLSILKEEDR